MLVSKKKVFLALNRETETNETSRTPSAVHSQHVVIRRNILFYKRSIYWLLLVARWNFRRFILLNNDVYSQVNKQVDSPFNILGLSEMYQHKYDLKSSELNSFLLSLLCCSIDITSWCYLFKNPYWSGRWNVYWFSSKIDRRKTTKQAKCFHKNREGSREARGSMKSDPATYGSWMKISNIHNGSNCS